MNKKEYLKEYRKKNKDKIKEYDRLYYQKNKDRRNNYSKNFFKNNKKEVGIRRIIRKYNISREEYISLLENQKYKCKICKKKTVYVVDHDHKTGKVRGLLCGGCNSGLGFFCDDIKTMENAIKYINESRM